MQTESGTTETDKLRTFLLEDTLAGMQDAGPHFYGINFAEVMIIKIVGLLRYSTRRNGHFAKQGCVDISQEYYQ